MLAEVALVEGKDWGGLEELLPETEPLLLAIMSMYVLTEVMEA